MATKAKDQAASASYDDGAIDVLIGLETVRRKPTMYMGELVYLADQCFFEAIDNSVDEAQAGHCDRICIELSEKNTWLTVTDNGRGIPIGMNSKAKNPNGSEMSNLKAVLSILHAGGKLGGGQGYKVSGGTHGVGISAVNALSKHLTATTTRDGLQRTIYFKDSVTCDADGNIDPDTDSELIDAPADAERGTVVSFTIDHKLPSLEGHGQFFSEAVIKARMKELSYLVPRTTFEFWKDGVLIETYYAESAAEHFNEMIAESGFNLLHTAPLHSRKATEVKGGFVDITIGMTDSAQKDSVKAYTNCIYNSAKGTHVTGALDGVYRAFKDLTWDEDEQYFEFEPIDIQRGSYLLLHVGIDNPAYSGQTKNKLVTGNAQVLCADHAYAMVQEFVEANWEEAVRIAQAAHTRCQNRKRNSHLAELEKSVHISGKGAKQAMLIENYVECSSNNPAICEMYIVEGDSASGNMKKKRDKTTQAILPLRGKIVNAAKAAYERVMAHKELQTLMTVVGSGILDICDPERCRFHKIIMAADADADGFHIRTELLTFFHMYLRPLVEAGYVYVALPPLYGATNYRKYKDYTAYGMTIADLVLEIEEYSKVAHDAVDTMDDDQLKQRLKAGGWNITRYKGLGEMSVPQTYETLLNPMTRKLVQITVDDLKLDDEVVRLAMGKGSGYRKGLLGGVPTRYGLFSSKADEAVEEEVA